MVSLILFLSALLFCFQNTNDGELSISPYPYGKDFAFSIVDDTDYSIGPDIKPVYDLLFKLGFRTTRTVWVFNQKHTNSFKKGNEKDAGFIDWGASLECKEYLKIMKDIYEKGFEIALHGISAGNDYRNDIIAGHEEFKRIFGRYPTMDILHAQNIENLYSGYHKLDNIFLKKLERLVHNSDYQAHVPGSDYFWMDGLSQHQRS